MEMLRLTNVESTIMKKSLVKNLLEANKPVTKLQSSTLRLVYSDLWNPEYLKVIVYRDVTHAGLPSGASQGAQIVFLCGNNRAFQSHGNWRN